MVDQASLASAYDEALAGYGSPLYVFSEAAIRGNYRSLRSALDDHYPDSVIHFAVKANFLPGILSVLRDEGCSAEVYAGGELTAAREAGFGADDLLVTGMNRRPEQVERALASGTTRFLVDNATELERLIAAAETTRTRPEVLVRCNPAISVPTFPEVATATRESKFGLDIESGRAMAVAESTVDSPHVSLLGVQLHIGSQLRGTEPYAVAARELLAFAAEIRDALGVEIDVLDLGGGFPVRYDEAVPGTGEIVRTMAGAISEACAEHDLSSPTLYVEPGRALVGDSGTLLATVGVVKETPYATFAVLDAGTNAVSSYWPYPISALSAGSDGADEREYHVAGPLCYSGDVLAEDVALPPLSRGDVLAVERIGAYSLGSASHTNAEPKPAVVLVREDGSIAPLRGRETTEDVLGGSRVPADLR
jgi:diaminopimelate decarboxylase